MFDDLDSATAPFFKRSVTILRRAGYFDDSTLFNTLTEAEVVSWWNAGVGTVADIRDTGNEAIANDREEVARHRRFEAGLTAVANEPWARHIGDRDPRFKGYLPKGGGTVYGIATSGSGHDRRLLWDQREALSNAVTVQAALTFPDAVAEYVEAISGQHGERLDMLLAVTGLNGQNPISAPERSRRVGRAPTRVGQLRRRLIVRRGQARPPAGAWLHQVGEAERDGWPGEYKVAGIEATLTFLNEVF